MSKRRRKGRRGVSNAEMRGYLKMLAMTNSSLINSTEVMIDQLVHHFAVPYERAETIVTTFRRDSRTSERITR